MNSYCESECLRKWKRKPNGMNNESGMSVKLWHNCGKPQFVVVFSQKLCCGCGCGVQFPKIVVGVGVVVDKI